MLPQMPLKFTWRVSQDGFANYLDDGNPTAMKAVQQIAADVVEQTESRGAYIWGPCGTGKTHLLHAACQTVSLAGRQASYLHLPDIVHDPLLTEAASEAFEGLHELDLVCLDEVQAIAGSAPWEQAVFSLFNQLWEFRKPLLISSTLHPKDCHFSLPDLQSRLVWGGVYELQTLPESVQKHALKQRADELGIQLSDSVLRYLIQHGNNDMNLLMACLDTLDYATLAEKRKPTLPFVREVLGLEETTDSRN